MRHNAARDRQSMRHNAARDRLSHPIWQVRQYVAFSEVYPLITMVQDETLRPAKLYTHYQAFFNDLFLNKSDTEAEYRSTGRYRFFFRGYRSLTERNEVLVK
ncbi:hypothetical protein [Nitrosomonas marina]|uniref:Uncharacterized protein n=1 Tax=Nitrosomonas marina TaxID=917 RepID=A0A1H8FZR6_9PROT|nr:hypothetical protein [Nitrosomonas marina]SEN37226.1 hypothetical protein SAMN05216325_11569 [Nitrosomonas marina]